MDDIDYEYRAEFFTEGLLEGYRILAVRLSDGAEAPVMQMSVSLDSSPGRAEIEHQMLDVLYEIENPSEGVSFSPPEFPI